MIVAGEALAGDLLCRGQCEARDVIPDRRQGLAALRVDLLLGVGQDPVTLTLGGGHDRRALTLTVAAAAITKLVRLLASGRELRLVLVQQANRLVAVRLGILNALLDLGAPLLDGGRERAEHVPLEDVERDEEHHDRPDNETGTCLEQRVLRRADHADVVHDGHAIRR